MANDLTDGLILLGWFVDGRATSEDEQLLGEIAREALARDREGTLNDATLIALSFRAFDLLQAGLLDPGERAVIITSQYTRSTHLAADVPLVDEAILAYYRGYHTAALALLFVVLERFLRSAIGWKPGMDKPTFKKLSEGVAVFPSGPYSDCADRLLKIFYAKLDPLHQPALLMNRHGLLHGMRGQSALDRMNVARALGLLDLLTIVELGSFRRGFSRGDGFEGRFSLYSTCVFLGRERALLGDR
jgi:hypothetical protein